MSTRTAVVAGVGHCLPSTVVTNADLAARLDTSDDWIRSRSGIRQRHVAGPDVRTSDLAVEAGRSALDSAGTDAADLLVLATSTPDHPCPATAPEVAARLGLGPVPAFDLNAVCSGFLYALSVATGMVTAGQARTALVVGADRFSALVDPDDRSTAFLFGDGAAALLLRAGERDEPGAVLSVELGSDGTQADLIEVPDALSAFRMQGQAVYRQAVVRMADTARAVCERTGWDPQHVDWFVGHQANQRILDAAATRLGLDSGRVLSNVDRVGNTAAASVPLALSEGAADGRLLAGQRVVLSAFGGGATWGAATLTWPDLYAAPRPTDERTAVAQA